MKSKNCFLLLMSGALLASSTISAQNATATVDLTKLITPNPKLLLGITYDCRSSLNLANYGQVGYHNTDGTWIAGIDAVFKDFPMSGLRYPANGIMQGFQWKKSVGAVSKRTPVKLFTNQNNPAQVMEFGFDEFMAMTAARGVNPADVQIMVPIYDSATVNLTATQRTGAIPYVVQSNADWVEYCNSPNDGKNPGGGTDWAAVRAANGHALPYGIKIWNMGNEPYTSGEYGDQTVFGTTGYNNYINDIVPIIDAMRAIDPTIKITVTVTGKITNAWTSTVLNSPLLQGKIYGINYHVFATEEVITGTIPYSVSVYESSVSAMASAAKAKGYKYILGDYAHAILGSQPSAAVQDLAMQWQGANLAMDFLLFMSQTDNIERSDFWTFGNTAAQWHPIRKNTNGTYTSMPLAELYKKMNPLFLDNSYKVTSTSPVASDAIPYSLRTGAFASSDLSKVNVISVNRDKVNTIPLTVSGMTGYSLSNAKLLTAASLDSDVIIETTTTAVNGSYSMPAMSVLVLEYTQVITGFENISLKKPIEIYPNPVSDVLNFSDVLSDVRILDEQGKLVLQEPNFVKSISVAHLPNGVYFLQSKTIQQQFVVLH